jgi:hypothetical protein
MDGWMNRQIKELLEHMNIVYRLTGTKNATVRTFEIVHNLTYSVSSSRDLHPEDGGSTDL